MGCCFGFSVRLNALWSIWYCLLTTLLHAYLVYAGIERYKLYADLHWHHQYNNVKVSACIHIIDQLC